MDLGTAETANLYREWARVEAHGSSPTYERLALAVAEDPFALEFLTKFEPAKRQPNLLFGALRWNTVTVEDPAEALACLRVHVDHRVGPAESPLTSRSRSLATSTSMDGLWCRWTGERSLWPSRMAAPSAGSDPHNEHAHWTVTDGHGADHEDAVCVWRAANMARFLPPTVERVARIRQKLADPGACLVIGRTGMDGDVLAMALAEPGRVEYGAGRVIDGYGHVSMVFVHPDMWGLGLGGDLLQGLHERASARGWSRTTLWTRASNLRARRLYEGHGYQASGHESHRGDGDLILQLERVNHTDAGVRREPVIQKV